MRIFFTSDTHFNHARIIELSKRPFASIPEMNEALVRKWNEVVGVDDTVYHLGDFAMGPKVEHKSFFDQLKGRKALVRGNHDQSKTKMLAMGWDEVHTTLEMNLDPVTGLEAGGGLRVYMAHIPPRGADPYIERSYSPEFLPEPPSQYDIWLCGHAHEKLFRRGKVINVGVDVWGFRPRQFQELLTAVEPHQVTP